MRTLRKRIWTWWHTRRRLAEELALANQRCRLMEEEVEHLRRLLTLHTDRVDSETWHHRAAGAEAKLVVQSMAGPK